MRGCKRYNKLIWACVKGHAMDFSFSLFCWSTNACAHQVQVVTQAKHLTCTFLFTAARGRKLTSKLQRQPNIHIVNTLDELVWSKQRKIINNTTHTQYKNIIDLCDNGGHLIFIDDGGVDAFILQMVRRIPPMETQRTRRIRVIFTPIADETDDTSPRRLLDAQITYLSLPHQWRPHIIHIQGCKSEVRRVWFRLVSNYDHRTPSIIEKIPKEKNTHIVRVIFGARIAVLLAAIQRLWLVNKRGCWWLWCLRLRWGWRRLLRMRIHRLDNRQRFRGGLQLGVLQWILALCKQLVRLCFQLTRMWGVLTDEGCLQNNTL